MLPLIPRFIVEASAQLAPLAARFGYTLTSSSDDWQAEVTLTRRGSSIRVTYGDRELTGQVVVARRGWPRSESGEYALWEWLDALDVVEAPVTNVDWLQTPERLADFVRDVAHALELHLPGILAAGRDTLARLAAARAARLAHDRDQLARRDLECVTARAARAFWMRQYGQVVELLEPFAARLGPADARKLAYARRHAAGSRP